MEYRKLPKGKNNELISTLGLGMGGIETISDEEITQVIKEAVDVGINFFDLCAGGKNVYAPFGKAIKEIRDKVYFQLHFGAVYNEQGEYGWTKDFNKIKETFEFEMKTLDIDYIDFGFIHCVDQVEDLEKLINNGTIDFIKGLKEKGIVHYIGFSSHTPSVAHKVIDLGFIDIMMFSINPAYDFEISEDELAIGTISERKALFQRCEKEQIAISVMKPFHAGKLLDAKTSPFHITLTHNQCLQYALDRPGVISCVPGVRNLRDLEVLKKFINASDEEKDYSIIGNLSPENVMGSCVYCNHCLPCPRGIDIGLVNKYYDLAQMNDLLAIDHYKKLKIDASFCIECGYCNNRCPFKVDQVNKMKNINEYFKKS